MSPNRIIQEIRTLNDRYDRASALLSDLSENDTFVEAYNNNQFYLWVLDGYNEVIRIHILDAHFWTRQGFNSLMRYIFGSWNDKLDLIYGTETHVNVVYVEPQLSIKVTYAYAPSDIPPEYLKNGCTLTRTEREVRSVLSITCPTKGAKE